MSHSVISLNRKQRTFFLLKGATHFILTFTLVDLLRTVSQGTGLLLNNNHTQANNTLLTNKTKELSVLYFGSTRTIICSTTDQNLSFFFNPFQPYGIRRLKEKCSQHPLQNEKGQNPEKSVTKSSIGKKPNTTASRKV